MLVKMSPRIGLWVIAAVTVVLLVGFITLDQVAPAGRRLIKIRGEDPVSYFAITHSILFDPWFRVQTNEISDIPPPDGRRWTSNQPLTGLPGSPWGVGYSFLEIPLLAHRDRCHINALSQVIQTSGWLFPMGDFLLLYWECTDHRMRVGGIIHSPSGGGEVLEDYARRSQGGSMRCSLPW